MTGFLLEDLLRVEVPAVVVAAEEETSTATRRLDTLADATAIAPIASAGIFMVINYLCLVCVV